MQIDELVVSLLLDASGFTKGQKDAAAAAQKGAADLAAAAGKGEKASTTAFEAIVAGLNRVATANEKSNERGVQAQKRTIESNKKVGESFEGAIRTGLTFLAVLAGARTVEDFTRKVTALDAALGRTAAGMGSSPQVLSGLGKAVERMGGDFNGAVAGMRALSDAYQDFRTTGSSALTEPLTRLQALSGKAVTFGKDTLANFESIADAIQALDQKGEHALADRLGRQILGSEDLTNLAKRGGPAVRAELAESARHGVVDPKDVEAAQKLQTAYVGLSQSVVGLGTKIETALSPYLTQLLTQLDELIEKHGNEWVQEFGAFLEKHKPDIEHFGTAIGDLAKSVEGIASSFSSGSPATVALEAFAALMAGRVIGAVTGLTSAMRVLGSLPIPGVLAGALGLPVLGAVAVAGVLASGDPNKALLDGGRPDVEPQDNNTGLPGVNDDARSDTSDAKAKVDQAGGLWDKFKKAIGWGDRLHDDAKTKEGVEDTAKNTKGILEVMKAQKDGLGADATVNAGGGASLGGGASNLRYGHRGGGSSGAYRGTPVPDAPYNGKNIDGLTEAQSKQYAAILGNRESGNRYGTTNPYGYVGRWQFGASALAENGYVRPGTTNAGLNDPNSWTGKGDVHSIAEWKANKGGVQDQALGEYTNRHYAQLKAAGVIRDGMGPSEVAGWLAAAHLKGVGGAVALSRGRDNVDANGTSASSYRRMMDGVGKGAGAAGPTAQAPVSAGTPATAVTDAEVFAARQRIAAGGRDPKDIALRDRYLKEQNTPKGAGTRYQCLSSCSGSRRSLAPVAPAGHEGRWRERSDRPLRRRLREAAGQGRPHPRQRPPHRAGHGGPRRAGVPSRAAPSAAPHPPREDALGTAPRGPRRLEQPRDGEPPRPDGRRP